MSGNQRGRLGLIAVAVLAGASMLMTGCGASPARTDTRPTATTPAVSAAAQTGLVTVSLPVAICPTTIAIASPPPPVSLPRTRPVPVPRTMAARLSVYTDDQGTMALVAPKGWSCAATFGADGSGGVVVYPHGHTPPRSWTGGWPLARTSAAEAIAGLETSACYTCTLGQACRLFPAAAATLRSYLGRPTCPVRPAAERAASAGPGIMGFQDPPGTKGDGVPSGGRNPADGVLTYHPHATAGSWLETCTLPGSSTAECTAILDTFISWYGQR